MSLNFNDFDKQNIKFDINELQKAYKEILKIKDLLLLFILLDFSA